MFPNSFVRTLSSALLCLTVVSTVARESAHGQQKPEARGDEPRKAVPAAGSVHFSSNDREIIRVYYKTLLVQQGSVVPGQATLSGNPGQSTVSIESGVSLTFKMRKTFKPFPKDLESQLQPLPENYVRGSIANDILIVNTLSFRVVDIVHDFLSSGLDRPKPLEK